MKKAKMKILVVYILYDILKYKHMYIYIYMYIGVEGNDLLKSYVVLPSQEEIEKLILQKRKEELLAKLNE